MNIDAAATALRDGKVSAVELVQESLRVIREKQASLNAFITVTEDLAVEQARSADEELAKGKDRGPLHGIPFALKDMFATKGIRTTGGSKLFEDYIPDHDSAVYERLRESGAVLMGKTGLHELAYGITSNNPHFGTIRNPRDASRIPGGSSGGSGVAVATGMVFFATGSDTGGSIRIPAAYCGCVGLKPTSGRVSRYGTILLDFSLDHLGPLTRSARDAGLVLNALAGYDRRDDTSSRRPPEDYAAAAVSDTSSGDKPLRRFRIGVARNFFSHRVQASVAAAFERSLVRLQSLGAELVHVEVPSPEALTVAGRVILMSEASALMSKYSDRRDEIGAEVLPLLDGGRFISAADYINAQRLRRVYQRDWLRLWHSIDALVTPATPIEAPVIGDASVQINGEEEDVRLASTRFARCLNVLGVPAIAVPFAADDAKLFTGLQIVTAPFCEYAALSIAHHYENRS